MPKYLSLDPIPKATTPKQTAGSGNTPSGNSNPQIDLGGLLLPSWEEIQKYILQVLIILLFIGMILISGYVIIKG